MFDDGGHDHGHVFPYATRPLAPAAYPPSPISPAMYSTMGSGVHEGPPSTRQPPRG
jgi:hypothetical protein